MEVVRLSSIADIKNVMAAMAINNFRLLLVVILFVMNQKPPCESISSTVIMAPIRKIRVSAISPILSST